MFSDQLPESVIKSLSIKVKSQGGINLGQGIPSFPTPSHIIDAAKASLSDSGIGIYPNFWGTMDLRNAVAMDVQKTYAVSLDPKTNILITVGAMEATATAILSIIKDRDIVGVITPDYCNHFPQVLLARGELRMIPMQEKEQWVLDIENVEKEAKAGMKLLILTNPSNPTGCVVSKKDLDALVLLSKTYGFWILSDETYDFLSYDQPFTSLLSYYPDHERLLVVRSFSKKYAMTGWRVGYLIGHTQVLASMVKTHDALVGCVPKISQHAALAALTGPQNCVSTFVATLRKRRDLTVSLLEKSTTLTLAKPSGAYYAFLAYKGNTPSAGISDELLKKENVAVVPGACFGLGGEGHIRISFAVDDAVLTEGIHRIVSYFEK